MSRWEQERNKNSHIPKPNVGSKVFRIKGPGALRNRDIVDVTEPELVGYFSLDGSRKYCEDSSKLAYFVPPKTEKVHFDLNDGIEKVQRKSPAADEEKIDNLLKWIELNHNTIKAPVESKQWIAPNFVCFRGLLTTILTTPYQSRDPWIICAAKWRGTIYLCAFKTLEEKNAKANLSKEMLKFMSWGFKFEKYLLSDAPDKAPDASEPVNEAEEFCCMFQRRFGEHTILFGAEMDGVIAEKPLKDPLPLKDLKFVELKTSRNITNERQDRSLRQFKLLKWWAQTFSVGINKVLCGFRDDIGIVHELKTYSHSEMEELSWRFWNSRSSINFCTDLLTWISNHVVNDCDKTIYKFEREVHGDITMTELSPDSDFSFMPSSYLEKTG